MRAAKISFIAGFFTLILLPPLQMVLPFVTIAPLEERRNPVPPPDLAARTLRGDGRLAADLNRWFDDHLGFRPLLVRVAHQIDYSLFRHSHRVLIGRDGWLFDSQSLQRIVRNERGGEELQHRLRDRLLAVARYLAQRDIRLVILAAPNKARIYRQYLPTNAPQLPADDQFAKLRRFLKLRPEWINVDIHDEACLQILPWPSCGARPDRRAVTARWRISAGRRVSAS